MGIPASGAFRTISGGVSRVSDISGAASDVSVGASVGASVCACLLALPARLLALPTRLLASRASTGASGASAGASTSGVPDAHSFGKGCGETPIDYVENFRNSSPFTSASTFTRMSFHHLVPNFISPRIFPVPDETKSKRQHLKKKKNTLCPSGTVLGVTLLGTFNLVPRLTLLCAGPLDGFISGHPMMYRSGENWLLCHIR